MKHARLEEFRQAAYTHLGKAHDATFELTDAILLSRKDSGRGVLTNGTKKT